MVYQNESYIEELHNTIETQQVKMDELKKALESMTSKYSELLIAKHRGDMEISEREKVLLLIGYMQGYEGGHNDTVESQYTDAEDSARDWLTDAIEDGGLSYSFDALTAKHRGEQ